MAELCAWLGAPTAYIGLGAEESNLFDWNVDYNIGLFLVVVLVMKLHFPRNASKTKYLWEAKKTSQHSS